MLLRDRVVLVTGGARGIGEGVARLYAREGAFVFIVSRTRVELDRVVSEIGGVGSRAVSFLCDITDREQVRCLYEEIVSSVGRLDILVNNAGILGEMKELMEYSEDVWDEVIAVNLSAVFYVTKVMLPLMIKSAGASIINVSSGVGRFPRGGWGAYAVSKCGLEGLSKVFADELLVHSIRVNTVNPGATRTMMRSKAYPDEDPLSLKSPEEILDIFLYLAIDSSSHISGQTFDAQGFSI